MKLIIKRAIKFFMKLALIATIITAIILPMSLSCRDIDKHKAMYYQQVLYSNNPNISIYATKVKKADYLMGISTWEYIERARNEFEMISLDTSVTLLIGVGAVVQEGDLIAININEEELYSPTAGRLIKINENGMLELYFDILSNYELQIVLEKEDLWLINKINKGEFRTIQSKDYLGSTIELELIEYKYKDNQYHLLYCPIQYYSSLIGNVAFFYKFPLQNYKNIYTIPINYVKAYANDTVILESVSRVGANEYIKKDVVISDFSIESDLVYILSFEGGYLPGYDFLKQY